MKLGGTVIEHIDKIEISPQGGGAKVELHFDLGKNGSICIEDLLRRLIVMATITLPLLFVLSCGP